jgi:hypothetical protein
MRYRIKTIRLSDSEHEALLKLALSSGRSASDVLRRLLMLAYGERVEEKEGEEHDGNHPDTNE